MAVERFLPKLEGHDFFSWDRLFHSCRIAKSYSSLLPYREHFAVHFQVKALPLFMQWGSPKENISTLLIRSSTGAQRGLWLIWHCISRHLPPREMRILLLGQLLDQVQLTALTLPQLHVNLDKTSTRIPQPPRREDEWGGFPFPSMIWVLSMVREREAHYISFFRAPWMENPLSPLSCPSCCLPAVLSWNHSVYILVWQLPPLPPQLALDFIS